MANEDLRSLLEDMLEVEERMAGVYSEIIKGSASRSLVQALEPIEADELKHAQNVKRMLDILDTP